MNNLNQEQALGSFFDKEAAAFKFNAQLRSFFMCNTTYTPAEVKEWLEGTLKASLNQNMKIAQRVLFSGLDLTDKTIDSSNSIHFQEFHKSCDVILEYFLFDQEAEDRKQAARIKAMKEDGKALKKAKGAALVI